MTLLPFEGSATAPAGALASLVFVEHAVPACALRHVFLTKTFSIPVTTFDPRFVACVANATTGPEVHDVVELAVQFSPRLGFSLSPLAAVLPSKVDANAVFGEQLPLISSPVAVVSQVSRTKTC